MTTEYHGNSHSIERVYARAIRSYRLRPLDCRGVLFRANLERESLARAMDGSLGWDELFAKGLEIKQVSGDHRFDGQAASTRSSACF